MIKIREDRRLGMKVIKAGVREFRYNVLKLLEAKLPVLVTRRIEVIGIYIPIRLEHPDFGELTNAIRILERLRSDVSTTGGKSPDSPAHTTQQPNHQN